MKKNKAFHIAAVSLIEIMMIFTIIGIVTGACVSLTKPKNEYMTKIKLYSAYLSLDAAAKNIASEGHLDFTTDPNTCTQERLANKICPDYNTGSYPGLNKQLPKVAYRSTEDNTDVDPGLTDHTIYNNLSTERKSQFLYLQSGLCQRLAKTFNVPESGINCSSKFTTFPENGNFTTTVKSIAPQLYLPNGQTIYVYSQLYYDYKQINGTMVKGTPIANNSTELEYAMLGPNSCATFNTIGSFLSPTPSLTHINFYLNVPNETRQAALDAYSLCNPNKNNVYNYWYKVWSQNKDYFLIYVDINGKMSTSNDKIHGPDSLNKDIFAFKMYREGSVLPDYYSGFPINALTAKLLIKDRNDANGKYVYHNSEYAIKPLVYSRCYANLTGTYSSGYDFDHTGICSYGNETREPLNSTTDGMDKDGCIDSQGNSTCKSVILKPSFFIR